MMATKGIQKIACRQTRRQTRRHPSSFPDSLADLGPVPVDPWGNPYRYLNIANVSGVGPLRKDHNLVPLNSDFDLYSMGEDGASSPSLTAANSRDDILRGNNGGFVGTATDY